MKRVWKIFGNIVSFLDKCKRDKINAYSAQSAFFIILSVIPFLMVFSSLLQYTSVTESMLLTLIDRLMPQYVAPLLISLVDEVYNRSMGIISVTAIAAIWSAAKGVQYITDGLNSVHNLEETRNWFVLRFWAAIDTVVFMVAIVFTLLVLVFGNSLHDLAIKYVPFLENAVALLVEFKGLVLLAILTFFFDVIFTALPNKKLTPKSQLPGALICSVAWYAFSFGLSVYVDYFNGFSMYGSLTTIALVMLWLYFCMYIMMMSAEINVVFNEYFQRMMERRKHKKQKEREKSEK
ncbi:MAG: YihY/virulence factor BrkB family protein [Roseburia sp.]|nr:YihY/virulence factor BrkB family protein [Roseburia sp.]